METGSKEWETIVRRGANEFGVSVGDEAMRGLSLHAIELVKFNRKMNLTTITDPFEIAVKHVIDSLTAAPYISDEGALLDIGSGGGFPGIPLKLVQPALKVTVIDGSARKISFLKHVIRMLNVDGLAAKYSRAEQMRLHPDERFDFVITRALGSLVKCIQLALPLLNEKKGTVIALRGRTDEDELAGVHREIDRYIGGRQSDQIKYDLTIHRFALPLSNDRRAIVIVQCHR